MPRYNATRWWSYWECAKVVFEEWRHITTFLESKEKFADISRQRLSKILMQNAVQLRVELSSLMELEKFIKVTCTLKGNGHLISIAFQKLEELRALIHVHNFPVILGVVQELFPLNIGDQQRWYQYGLRECVTPAFQYFLNTLANDLVVSPTMKMIRAAQLFSPRALEVSRPTAADAERVGDVPFLNTNDVIQSLKDELPTYLVKAAAINDAFDIFSDSIKWWADLSPDLSSWSSAVQKVVLGQPSSAAAERVFSLLVTMFGDQQRDALEDYAEAYRMLRVNDR